MPHGSATVTALLVAVLGLASCPVNTASETPLQQAKDERERMVREQIEARGVSDARVLKALRKVPREAFMPRELAQSAYWDSPQPIGHGQTISQPYIVAYMTEQLKLSGNEKVLEIGTGSGYQAAILGELADRVYTIEIVEPLAKKSREVLAQQGYENIEVRAGDGYRGWPEQAPFDAILLTAAPAEIPQPLIDQLAEGGRLVAPVGEGIQELVLVTRGRSGIQRRPLIGVRFVPMTGEARQQ